LGTYGKNNKQLIKWDYGIEADRAAGCGMSAWCTAVSSVR